MIEKEFLEIIQTNSGIIHKICRLYRESKEDREDLFQEITFQLWKAFPLFQKNSKISTWIYRVALNTAVATFRKKSYLLPILKYYQNTLMMNLMKN